MRKTVKVKFINGALVPLEPVDLVEGTEYWIDLEVEPKLTDEERLELLQSAAGAWAKEDAYWEKALRMIYEARGTRAGE